jgi:ABC-type cobalamin/Fe3+-siderophores transport system ATPase subunit
MTNIMTGRGVVVERDGRMALRASDFTVPAAAITAIIGPNGSGKSTLLARHDGAVTSLRGHLGGGRPFTG